MGLLIKATHPLSVADAWIAAVALQLKVTLVHKDPDFENLPELLQERLPYKNREIYSQNPWMKLWISALNPAWLALISHA